MIRSKISTLYHADPNDDKIPVPRSGKVMSVNAFFHPLVQCFRYTNFLDCETNTKSSTQCQKFSWWFLRCFRIGYLTLMWMWTISMSINIFFKAFNGKNDDGSQSVNNNGHGNIVIILLEQTPFSFITLRGAIVLTIFVNQLPKILEGIDLCEDLACRLASLTGQKPNFHSYRHRPPLFIAASFIVIILWEIYEWVVWITDAGFFSIWDFSPFAIQMQQFQYLLFWVFLTTIPFILSQLTLCFPVLFAYVLRKYCRCINKELIRVKSVLQCDTLSTELRKINGEKVHSLRIAHFDLCQLLFHLNKALCTMLLVQFLLDFVVLFGFVGLLVKSKDENPPLTTLEWTFYIPCSLIWFGIFLFQFSFPLINLAEEGERTHQLVYALTFSSSSFFQEKYKELSVFLTETRHTVMAFTGGNFYYINRHYVVTCVALIGTYLTILTEILDRHFSNEELKHAIENLGHVSSCKENCSIFTPSH